MRKPTQHRGGGAARHRRSTHQSPEMMREAPPPVIPEAPLKRVMAMNHAAMNALQSGDMEGSHSILTEALEMVQQGLAEATVAVRMCSPAQEDEEQSRKEAWLLALSVTVSNLGCQLRKANKSEEALSFLYKAKEAEVILYGKPSSSTMLNISAILLGRGDLKESLEIAQDCVAASAEGDKVLHVTALHNFAMALGQQLEESLREEALHTMHRCLDEAEKHLGISHPTTSMIRDRCLNTDRWIADVAYVQRVVEARRHGVLSDVAPKRLAPPVQEERVALPPSEAVEGDAVTAGILADAEKDKGLKSKQRVSIVSSHGRRTGSSSGKKRRKSSSEEKADNAEKKKTGGILRSGSAKGRKSSPPKKNDKRRSSSKAEAPPEPKVMSAELQLRAKRALESLQLGTTPYPPEKRIPKTVPNRNLPALLSAPAEPGQPTAPDTNPVPPLPPIVAEGQPATTGQIPHYAGVPPGPPLAAPTHGAVAPRPQRSGAGSPSITPAPGLAAPMVVGEVPPSPQLTAGGSTHSLHVDMERSISIDQPPSSRNITIDTVLADKNEKMEDELSTSSVLISSAKVDPQESAPVSGRQHKPKGWRQTYTHLAQENNSFLRFAAVEDSGETQPFSVLTYKQLRETIRTEAGWGGGVSAPVSGKRVVARKSTSPVAALALEDEGMTNQDLSAFKKPDLRAKRDAQRKLQLKEEAQYKVQLLREREKEERGRKFKEGLAIVMARTENRVAALIQRTWLNWWKNIGKPRREAQKLRAAERQKRVHNRQLVETVRKNAALKGDWTLSGLPPPIVVVNCKKKWLAKTYCLRYLARRHIYHNSRNEASILALLTLAQARIRGMLARARYKRIQTLRVQLLQESVPHEKREYAALLIQKMFRCHRARRVLAEKHRNHYEPAAVAIQEWYRMIMFDQRARGVDTRSVRRKLNAIVLLQKTWRGYLGRVKYYMALLRRDMNQHTIAEQRGSRLLQRVGRGCLQRRWMGNYAVDQCVERLSRERFEAAAAQGGQDEGKTGAPHANTPVVPRTEYERECLKRADEVYREQQRNREEYDVPLFLEPEAERQRLAWEQAIRLNPSEVKRRRAVEDLRCQMEYNHGRRLRAAVKIQREFRAWLNARDSKDRDTDYLTICKGVYHQREYERILQEKEYLRHQAKGMAVFGDVAVHQHQCAQEARDELRREIDASKDYIEKDQIRTRQQRLVAEKALLHDEEVLRITLPKDLKRLRENPVDVKKNTGAMYENPTLRGLPSEGYRKLYDLD